MIRILLPLLAAALLLPTLPLAAQEEPDDPWDVELEFGLNGASGNSDFTVLRAGATATRTQADVYALTFSTVVRYGTNDDEVISDDAKASVRLDWRPEARFSPFVFVDAARDEIRNLDFQAEGGAGAQWAFLQRESGNAALSLAALFDYQNFDLEPDAAPEVEETESDVRWSFRFTADRSFGEGAAWEHETFYQPVFDDFGDYVVEITNTLSTSLLENLSLAVEHLYLRDAVPPPGAGKDDQKFSILFRLGL